MTNNGKQVLLILLDLEERYPEDAKLGGFTASDITTQFKGLPERRSPVMTVSSYLTHLKRDGYVKRKPSGDKTTAWWGLTAKGRRMARAKKAK